MSKIGIVAKVERPPMDLLRALVPHVAEAGLAGIAGRLRDGDVLTEREVFDGDWKEVHDALRAILTTLRAANISYQLYELVDDGAATVGPDGKVSLSNGHFISEEVLENILHEFAEGVAEQARKRSADIEKDRS